MSDPAAVGDAGFDDFLDAVAVGEGYYLACPNGHGWLPPRRVCPTCGERDLEPADLPDAGTVASFTVVHVPTPQFEDWAPYATIIADFGPVRITGILRGADPSAVALGQSVRPGVVDDDGIRRIVFDLV